MISSTSRRCAGCDALEATNARLRDVIAGFMEEPPVLALVTGDQIEFVEEVDL